MSDPIDLVRARLRDVPDFPKPGILFKDITPVLGDAAAFSAALDALVAYAAPRGVTRVLGVEARGFIFGAALATRMNLGFVPARGRSGIDLVRRSRGSRPRKEAAP